MPSGSLPSPVSAYPKHDSEARARPEPMLQFSLRDDGGGVTGTIINTATVLVGGTLGTFLGNRFPAGVRSLLFQTIGLITLILGLQRALGTTNILILLVSVVLGGILGEFLHIEDGLEAFGNLAQKHLGTPPLPDPLPRGGRGQIDHSGASNQDSIVTTQHSL